MADHDADQVNDHHPEQFGLLEPNTTTAVSPGGIFRYVALGGLNNGSKRNQST